MSIKALITRFLASRQSSRRSAATEDDRLVEKLVQSGVAANKLPPR
jgi:hypothetical protein